MKLKCNVTPLCAALEYLRPLYAGRTTLPVLACVKLVATGSTLTVSANDLDIACTVRVECEITKEGEAVVSGQRLLNALKASSGECVLTAEKSLAYASGRTKATLGLSQDPWQETGAPIDGQPMNITGEELSAALKKVLPAISHDQARFVLCGVYFEADGGCLRLVGTNGAMLITTATTAKCQSADAILSETACNLLAGITGDLRLAFAENGFSCDSATLSIRGNVVNGNYPNWKQALPSRKEHEVKLTFSKAEFLQSLRYAASLGVVGHMRAVKAEPKDGELILSSSNQDDEANQSVSINTQGKAFDFKFNADLMAGLLSASDNDEITIEMRDATSPMIVQEKETLGVLLPIRVA